MARRKRAKSGGPAQMWLVTFGDLVTLLLTFFVLLLSMSSMDHSFLTRITVFTKDFGFLTDRGAGKVPSRVRMVYELIERPQDMLLPKDRIKDLLFPDDVLPDMIDKKTLQENLEILSHPEGVALVLSDRLLFETASARLGPGADAILTQIGFLLMLNEAPVVVSGHSDNVGGASDFNFALSGDRAFAVLGFFLAKEFDPIRFSVAGYGPNQPMYDNETEEGRARNRRVEILLKTHPRLGSYS
ncbi:OmpA/MotB domain protein [Alkalidesulfovibrio alkalitolerans DSM 16529]|uniref:OmpA/MotB domain protein n=1 Tax=Alkalidesulfovibrio alkalitolerans DSM 16529 TaxID=1121439 RepID=S7TBH3_9BACT|nr:OmpA family protein [Alkalidesulfovibrio alkalitolerans]EPR34507.1 OmpA/MotB domain protein [Alkalidesulfovibrio alkalitolerans DSM 16529]